MQLLHLEPGATRKTSRGNVSLTLDKAVHHSDVLSSHQDSEQYSKQEDLIYWSLQRKGRCAGASGRAMAFYPSGQGLNPRIDLAWLFSVQICCQSILPVRWGFFLKNVL